MRDAAWLLLALAASLRLTGQQTLTTVPPHTFTASVYAGLHEPIIEVLLYNPPVPQVEWKLPYQPGSTTRTVVPVLVVYARGLADGPARLNYAVDAGDSTLLSGSRTVLIEHGGLEIAVNLDRPHPNATHLTWECLSPGRPSVKGRAALRWSRFRGQLQYLDGVWRSSYIEMWPNGFRAPGAFYVPVGDDGRFDVLMPSRVYSVMNVNGSGYNTTPWSGGAGTTTSFAIE